MRKVKSDKLKVGDVLAKDIISKKGITILKKGTELSDKFIANIKKISAEYSLPEEMYIFIEGTGSGSEKDNKISGENKEEMEKEIESLEKRFKNIEGYEYTEDIKDAIKNQIIKFYGETHHSEEQANEKS
ncbi:MAG: hypothetical protein ACP5NA_05575 [Candidatus Acidulodesulfobacterium sp.]